MRLTEKNKIEQAKKTIELNGEKLVNDSNLVYAKLGQLEDIEEELGIDLITLFKILSQFSTPIYCKSGNIFSKKFERHLVNQGGSYYVVFYIKKEYAGAIALSRFNKDWALTEEELL